MDMDFYQDANKRCIVYSNHNDLNLQVDSLIEEALQILGFEKKNDGDEQVRDLRLVIWHGELPGKLFAASFNYPIVRLEMSSAGFIDRPEISNTRTGIYEPYYAIQGKSKSSRIPNNTSSWTKLIDWLLFIYKKKWADNEEVPLPSDPEIKKFVYTEPYPEELLSLYLTKIANTKGIHISLDEQVKCTANDDFEKLCSKYFGKVEKSIENMADLHSLFHKLSSESAK